MPPKVRKHLQVHGIYSALTCLDLESPRRYTCRHVYEHDFQGLNCRPTLNVRSTHAMALGPRLNKKGRGRKDTEYLHWWSLTADSVWLTASHPHHRAYSTFRVWVPCFTFVPAKGKQLIQKIGIMSGAICWDKHDPIAYRTVRRIWKHLEIQVTGALKFSKESSWGHPHSNLPVRMLRKMQTLEARSWGLGGK